MIKNPFFFIHIFGPEIHKTARIQEIRTGSGALALTEDVWHQMYENKKKAFEIIKNSHSIKFWKSPFVPGTELRMRIWPKTGSEALYLERREIFKMLPNR